MGLQVLLTVILLPIAVALESDDIGDKLEKKWADDAASATSNGWINTASSAASCVQDAVSTVKDPGYSSTGKLLADIGAGLMFVPDPPVAQVFGIAMTAVGGLLQAFDPNKPTPPTNQDILDNIATQFQNLNHKLGLLEDAVSAVKNAVDRLSQTLGVIGDEVAEIYDYTKLHGKEFELISSTFSVSMDKFKIARDNPSNPKAYEDFHQYVIDARSDFQHGLINDAVSPDNFQKSVEAAILNQDRCTGALVFQAHVATRFKLYWIMQAGSFFLLGNSTDTKENTEVLAQHIGAYKNMVTELRLDHLVNQSDTNLNRYCLRAGTPFTLQYPKETKRSDSNPWIAGFNYTDACPRGYSAAKSYGACLAPLVLDLYRSCRPTGVHPPSPYGAPCHTTTAIDNLPAGCYLTENGGPVKWSLFFNFNSPIPVVDCTWYPNGLPAVDDGPSGDPNRYCCPTECQVPNIHSPSGVSNMCGIQTGSCGGSSDLGHCCTSGNVPFCSGKINGACKLPVLNKELGATVMPRPLCVLDKNGAFPLVV